MGERGDRPDVLLRFTTVGMLVADVAFVAYWVLVAGRLLPADRLFAEYADPRVVAWNWSFLPLDLAASVTGLLAATALRSGSLAAPARLVLSLALTATAGGMAVAYWAYRGQWDASWLVPNLLLAVLPLPMLVRLMRTGRAGGAEQVP
jgi:hypothetical protein